MSSKSFSSASNPFNGSKSSRSPLHGFWAKLYLASTLGAVLTYTIDLILGEFYHKCLISNFRRKNLNFSDVTLQFLDVFFLPFKVSILSLK